MATREPDLYKDKIEVSLDGRQIFYLFFGGAVIVGLVFVVGVMVGRRVEARGHLDRAQTQTATDPLAALDRLEGSGSLSFHGALTGNGAVTDVEKAIGEIEKSRKHQKPEPPKVEVKPEVKPEPPKPEAKPEPKPEPKAAKPDHDADKPKPDHDADKPKADKKPKHHDDDKPVTKPEASADAPHDTKFTLQLSSFQDRSEAEAFLDKIKAAGFSPYLTEAEVSGKGTFYRVRLGSYRSLEAANDAKAEFEKSSKKTAQVMRL